MKYLDEYRDPEQCRRLSAEIRRTATQLWSIMEVCGGQTHGLLRYGIDQQLDGCVRLIHGPGCPVCVTPLEAIDFAIELARRPGVVLASFGDMLRVPGSRESLLAVRGAGGQVRIVYSPLDAVKVAQQNPDQDVVFFAVGFETTTPATALAVQQAAQLGLDNFSLLVSHVRVQPAMEQLAARPENRVQGFLAAWHVCTVAGFESYEQFVRDYHLPVVVTGFEPVDLLVGILECVRQLERGESRVVNCYERSVTAAGNREALAVVDDVYEICDRPWRGMGVIPGGGLRLRAKYAAFDAMKKFGQSPRIVSEPPECRSGDVLTGRIKPTECECFGTRCTPETPLGAPMVSAEGACAAYYRYALPTATTS
jgi:hydrogenase expression/formation protein HypD